MKTLYRLLKLTNHIYLVFTSSSVATECLLSFVVVVVVVVAITAVFLL